MREVEIAGRRLCIHENDGSADGSSSNSLTGGWVWDCALILAHWIDTVASGAARSSSVSGGLRFASLGLGGARIVELGAGTGLPGLTAAALGAEQVILTDRPALLRILRRNVEANDLSAVVRVEELEWGGECSQQLRSSSPVDYVLCSDVMYDVESMPALAKTMLELSDEKTRILVAYELRLGTTECFAMLKASGLRWTMVPNEELHPVWRSDDIGIFVMRRAPE